MDKYLQMLKGMGGFALTPIATALVTLLVLPIVSRVYPAEEYGRISIFFSTGTILMYLLSLGLDSACIRYYSEPELLQTGLNARKLLGFSIKMSLLIVFLVGTVCVLAFGASISEFLFSDENVASVVLLALFTAALVVFRFLNVKARMEMNAKTYNFQCIAQNLITRALFAVAVVVSAEYFASIAFMSIALVVACAFFFFLEKGGFDFGRAAMNAKCIRSMYSFGIASMLTILVLQLNSNLAKYVLSAFGQHDAVGVFAVASTLATAFNVLPSAFGTYWSPYMYKNYRTEQTTIGHVHDGLVIASIVIVAIIMLFQGVLYAIIGSGYAESRSYFMLIMLAPISSFICETTGYGIALSNRMRLNVAACVIGLASNLFISMLLVPCMGAKGAAIGVAVSAIAMGVLKTIWGQLRYRSITSGRKTLLGCSVITALCISNCFVFNSLSGVALCSGLALAMAALIYRRDLGRFVILLQISSRNVFARIVEKLASGKKM